MPTKKRISSLRVDTTLLNYRVTVVIQHRYDLDFHKTSIKHRNKSNNFPFGRQRTSVLNIIFNALYLYIDVRIRPPCCFLWCIYIFFLYCISLFFTLLDIECFFMRTSISKNSSWTLISNIQTFWKLLTILNLTLAFELINMYLLNFKR